MCSGIKKLPHTEIRMANEGGDLLTPNERYLEMLLKEGTRYLIIMDKLRNFGRIDSTEYKRMLFVMDRYSRYKAQLREDMEELKEIFGVDGMGYVEYDIEDGEDEEYMVIDFEEGDEEDDLFLEEELRHFNNIVHRKNILANMEMLILQMLNMDGTLLNLHQSLHTKLRDLLSCYYQKVRAFLKRNAALTEAHNDIEKRQLIKSVRDKYNQLQQLMAKLTEKQIIIMEAAAQPHTRDKNEERESDE